ncbi:MAG: RluA family pseudouridine synthase [Kiritimatiellae bacterium]|nr:RluA family pseudouridine synthase [Kiritimatiellia bacterium]
MMSPVPHIPARFRPRGITFLYEDRDLVVIDKAEGVLTTDALYGDPHTAEAAVTAYLRKGAARSSKRAYLVHRLDRETSGVLLFAKSEEAQTRLKENWRNNEKIYLALVEGQLAEPAGIFESALVEDEDYFVHSVDDPDQGKWARTQYAVCFTTERISAVKIRLLTGRKNQIRVHFSEAGHPVVGDWKYGASRRFRAPRLFLHAQSIAFDHPHNGGRMVFEAPIPASFWRFAEGFTEEDWRKG